MRLPRPQPQARRLALLGLALAATLTAQLARAAVELPAIFGNHMVLPRDRPIPVWGRADAGEAVTVQLGDTRATTRADAQGDWRVDLPARPAGAPTTLTVTGGRTLTFTDVLLGDVWLCSGQSNMTLRLDQATDASREIAAARHPRLRLFTVKRAVAATPAFTCEGTWTACSPATVGAFSAVAYHFGRKLQEELDVPIGLIHSSWGGTAAEAWTPLATLEADPALRPILARWAAEVADFPRKKADFETNREKLVAAWKQAVEEAKTAGRMPPAEPRLRTGPGTQYQPAGLYHGMIAPLAPFGLRGVIWYQGEANAGRAHQYRTLFPALITAWRERWQRPDLAFLFVQLPNLARQPEPSRSGWAELREAQALSLALPHTGMAVTIDVGDPGDLHPKNKLPVGERLARVAAHVAYGQPAADSLPPVYRASAATGADLRVTLSPGPLRTTDGAPPRGFVIAGADAKFVPAEARIEGDAVIVHSSAVPVPVAVRYAWADNPDCNLASAAGLPASPFRTDDWPAVTTGRQ